MLVHLTAARFLIAVTAGILLTAACVPQPSTDPDATATAQPQPPAATATPLPSTPTAAPAGSPTPTVNITVASPTAGQTIANPVRITGKARVFEAALMVALKDSRGNLLGEMPVMASAGGPAWGDYTADLRWDPSKATTDEGTIEAFTHSARDGSVIDLFTVKVTLPARPAATPSVSPGAARTPSPSPSPAGPAAAPTAASGAARTPSPGPTRSP